MLSCLLDPLLIVDNVRGVRLKLERRVAMIRGIREAEQCGEIAMMIDAGAAGMEFQDWMASVDAIFDKEFGVTSEDLPDCLYADLWEDGATPLEVASGMEEILVG